MLEGIETVGDCMADENMSAFVKKCVYEEIIPTLDLSEAELIDYADNVFERFKNPYIRHLCSSISLNSVSKFKVRVLPSILEFIKRYNKMPENLLVSFGKLIKFYKEGTPNDDEKVIAFMKSATVAEILANKDLWDEDLSSLASEVARRM
jgi:tagaturonate reductase